MNAPVLVAPNLEEPFVLHAYASQYAAGETLAQKDEVGQLRVIAHTSKKLTTAEKNYTAHDRIS